MSIPLEKCLSRIINARVLVTGGAGFIGSHLVDYLLDHDVGQVVIVDNYHRPRQDWVESRMGNNRIKWVEADIVNIDFIPLLKDIDVIFHLAAISRVMDAESDPQRTFMVNTIGTLQTMEAAQAVGVQRLVFSSSREIYGDPKTLPVSEDCSICPKNTYGASKAAAEMYLRTLDSQLDVVTLRLSNVYGPGDQGRVIPTFFENMYAKQPLILFGGEQIIDFIWIEDVVRTLIKAGFSQQPVRQPVNLGSGVGVTIRDLAERVTELGGNNKPIQVAPSRDAEVHRFQADISRACQVFGLFKPDRPLDKLSEMFRPINQNDE